MYKVSNAYKAATGYPIESLADNLCQSQTKERHNFSLLYKYAKCLVTRLHSINIP